LTEILFMVKSIVEQKLFSADYHPGNA